MLSEPPRFSHLAPELRALRDEDLALWGDAAERRHAIEAIASSWQRGTTALPAAIDRVDRAVVEGLRVLGLARGPVAAIDIEEVGRGWVGRKEPDCRLRFDGLTLCSVVAVGQADLAFRSWIHESLHGRLPHVANTEEQTAWRGYEEGLAEGLARLVTRDKAGIVMVEASYSYYVGAYHALARTLDLDVERLWRALWQHPPGRVRAAFVPAIEQLSHRSLTPQQRRRLAGIGDRQFSTERLRDGEPDEQSLRQVWEWALK